MCSCSWLVSSRLAKQCLLQPLQMWMLHKTLHSESECELESLGLYGCM